MNVHAGVWVPQRYRRMRVAKIVIFALVAITHVILWPVLPSKVIAGAIIVLSLAIVWRNGRLLWPQN